MREKMCDEKVRKFEKIHLRYILSIGPYWIDFTCYENFLYITTSVFTVFQKNSIHFSIFSLVSRIEFYEILNFEKKILKFYS